MATHQTDLGPEEVIPSIFKNGIEEDKQRICEIDYQMDNLRKERAMLIRRNIHLCDHPLNELYIRSYKSNRDSMILNPEPEWIICKKCGLTERGWGIGHVALKHGAYKDLPKISDEKWNEWKTVMIHEEDKIDWRN